MKYLYCIENNITKKRYVGVTIDPDRRWKQHTDPKSKKNSAIKDAIQKYDKENFTMTLLCIDEDSVIDDLEVELIKEWDTQVPNGYNFTTGGDGASYKVWDEDWNELLGTKTDRVLAEDLGYSNGTIASRRKSLGIPSYRESTSISWANVSHMWGNSTDKEIGDYLGVNSKTVFMHRKSKGITAFAISGKEDTFPQELYDLMGTMPDPKLAEMFGYHVETIGLKRRKLGIPRYVKEYEEN
ncbi:GIY-YIG nuclease superfamily protein, partial [Vibrio phage 1.170.O._10N.261.52.C3]